MARLASRFSERLLIPTSSRPAAWAMILLLTGFSVLTAPPAHALSDRAKLEKWCMKGTSVAAEGRCIGYLLAVEDVLAHDAVEGIRACLPADLTLTEQHRIVVEWLQAQPPTDAHTAAGLVARAYATRYPCHR